MTGDPWPAVEIVAFVTEIYPFPRSVAHPAQWSFCVLIVRSDAITVPSYVASSPREELDVLVMTMSYA